MWLVAVVVVVVMVADWHVRDCGFPLMRTQTIPTKKKTMMMRMMTSHRKLEFLLVPVQVV